MRSGCVQGNQPAAGLEGAHDDDAPFACPCRPRRPRDAGPPGLRPRRRPPGRPGTRSGSPGFDRPGSAACRRGSPRPGLPSTRWSASGTDGSSRPACRGPPRAARRESCPRGSGAASLPRWPCWSSGTVSPANGASRSRAQASAPSSLFSAATIGISNRAMASCRGGVGYGDPAPAYWKIRRKRPPEGGLQKLEKEVLLKPPQQDACTKSVQCWHLQRSRLPTHLSAQSACEAAGCSMHGQT